MIYLNGSLKGGLKHTRAAQEKDVLEGYLYVNYARNVTLGNPCRVLCLHCLKQLLVGRKINNLLWISELGITEGCVKIHCDKKKSVIHLANHQVYHERTQHINILLHFIRDMIESMKTIVEKIASEDNLAEVFTISLPRSRFKHWLDLINFVEE